MVDARALGRWCTTVSVLPAPGPMMLHLSLRVDLPRRFGRGVHRERS